MARMLFVTWRDGAPPSQFSVPPDLTIADIRRDDGFHEIVADVEVMLATDLVRTIYLVEVPDGTFIHQIEHADVAPAYEG